MSNLLTILKAIFKKTVGNLVGKNNKIIGRTQHIFRAGKWLCAAIVVDIRHYRVIQTHKMHNARSETQGKLWAVGGNVSEQVH